MVEAGLLLLSDFGALEGKREVWGRANSGLERYRG
jgi:hypothetical protein